MQSFSINLGSTLTSPMQTNFHLFPFHLELPLQVVTTLVPYGPERPKVGLQDMSGTTEDKVEIFWDPPKGEFTKYTLEIDRLNVKQRMATYGTVTPKFKKANSNNLTENIYEAVLPVVKPEELPLSNRRYIENLSYKLTRYTISGLEPAEAYLVTLGTKTGQVNILGLRST